MIEIGIRVDSAKLFGKMAHQTYRGKSFNKSVIVGYGTRYSIYVHEDMQKPPKNGQRKFLTGAERQTRPEYLHHLTTGLMEVPNDKPFPMVEILLGCCTIIMSRSQTLVPVDTGQLKNSKFQRED